MFSVVATNAAPLSYQWTLSGLPISGATKSAYSLANVQPSAAGSYAVAVWNSLSTVTSAPAILVVQPILTMDSNGVLRWSGAFTLQTATNAAGPYSDITGATSPYTNTDLGLPSQFFRLRQ